MIDHMFFWTGNAARSVRISSFPRSEADAGIQGVNDGARPGLPLARVSRKGAWRRKRPSFPRKRESRCLESLLFLGPRIRGGDVGEAAKAFRASLERRDDYGHKCLARGGRDPTKFIAPGHSGTYHPANGPSAPRNP